MIDMREVWLFMCRIWWLIPAIMVAAVGIISVLSLAVTESYEATALVRLAKVGSGDKDVGAQAMVVKRLQIELGSNLNINYNPRPNGMVMVLSNSQCRDDAVRNAQLASDELVDDSNKSARTTLEQYDNNIAPMGERLKQLDQLIAKNIAMGDHKTIKENPTQAWFLVASTANLLRDRDDLAKMISYEKMQMETAFRSAAVVSPPVSGTQPFRPRWTKNVIIGILFGLFFGVFVLFLLAVFDQLFARNGQDRTYDALP